MGHDDDYDDPSQKLINDDSDFNTAPTKSIFDPRTTVFRILVLIGCCFLTFGSYFCYDIPGALSDQLLDPFYDITSFEYSLFYSLYSLPNTVLPFFGGMLVDRILGVKV